MNHTLTRPARTAPRGARPPWRSAFTLVEMLVVVTIIIIIILIAVPAFQAMLYSNSRIQAEEGMKTGLALGRDAAIRAGQGQDAAAVFIYEPGSGLKIVACQKIGTIEDIDLNRSGPAQFVQREVFVPVTAFEPVSLPRNWVVRGYATAGAVDASWYETSSGLTRYTQGASAWVFPETGFFDADLTGQASDAYNRQTFMVRFEGGTGAVSPAAPHAALVIYPRDSRLNRTANPVIATTPALRLDTAQDILRTAQRIMTDRLTVTTEADRRKLLGEQSGDCILVKPVTQLALHDETRLAAALGIRINPVTGCIYAGGKSPLFVQPTTTGGSSQPVTGQRIGQWIEGDTNFDGQFVFGSETNGRIDEPQAKLYILNRFLGTARQIALQPGQNGVTP